MVRDVCLTIKKNITSEGLGDNGWIERFLHQGAGLAEEAASGGNHVNFLTSLSPKGGATLNHGF